MDRERLWRNNPPLCDVGGMVPVKPALFRLNFMVWDLVGALGKVYVFARFNDVEVWRSERAKDRGIYR